MIEEQFRKMLAVILDVSMEIEDGGGRVSEFWRTKPEDRPELRAKVREIIKTENLAPQRDGSTRLTPPSRGSKAPSGS